VIRVAAVGDVHVGADSRGRLRPSYERVAEQADVLLVAGDLTRRGTVDEAKVFVSELRDLGVPTVCVLGNHDYHAGEEGDLVAVLQDNGFLVLEGRSAVVETPRGRLGVAGSKGFGGGFAGACASDFGEPEMKSFVSHTKAVAGRLCDALSALDGSDVDHRVALLHYAPVPDTLAGERLEIYPFLGSYLLAEAVDRAGADLVLHGHAHAGSERGLTAGGVPVRNVAQPVIRRAYAVYCLGAEGVQAA
jgi:Icc-related predicted phosphoesterase